MTVTPSPELDLLAELIGGSPELDGLAVLLPEAFVVVAQSGLGVGVDAGGRGRVVRQRRRLRDVVPLQQQRQQLLPHRQSQARS